MGEMSRREMNVRAAAKRLLAGLSGGQADVDALEMCSEAMWDVVREATARNDMRAVVMAEPAPSDVAKWVAKVSAAGRVVTLDTAWSTQSEAREDGVEWAKRLGLQT